MNGKPKMNPHLSARYIANRRANELNRRYYYQHKSEFLRRYKNKYVAISEKRLIDVDEDRIKLLDRVFEDFGETPVFFAHVTSKPRVVHIPSYALVRSVRRA